MQIIFIIYQILLYLFSSIYLFSSYFKVIATLDQSKQLISYLDIYTLQIIIHIFLSLLHSTAYLVWISNT